MTAQCALRVSKRKRSLQEPVCEEQKGKLFLQSPSSLAVFAEENLAECLPKIGGKYRVDHRIEKTVQVAEPGENADDFLVDRQMEDAADRLLEKEW